jgi:hypothetical protein
VFQVPLLSFAAGEVKALGLALGEGVYGPQSNWIEYRPPPNDSSTGGVALEPTWSPDRAVYLRGSAANLFPVSSSSAANQAVTSSSGSIDRIELLIEGRAANPQVPAWILCQVIENVPVPSVGMGPTVVTDIHEQKDNAVVDGPTTRDATAALLLREPAKMLSSGWSLVTPQFVQGDPANPVDVAVAPFRDFNPRAIAVDFASAPGNLMPISALNGLAPPQSDSGYSPTVADPDAKFGFSIGPAGSNSVILFEVPRSNVPVLSIGRLQHVMLAAGNGAPSYVFGNSMVSPFAIDFSENMNRALWDRYFFSGFPPGFYTAANAGAGQSFIDDPNSTLPSSRLKFVRRQGSGPQVSELSVDWLERPAGYLFAEGAFNVNSVSEEAWKSVLGSLRSVPVENATGVNEEASDLAVGKSSDDVRRTPIPRFTFPSEQALDPSVHNSASDSVWLGHRRLSDAEIESLATEVVGLIRSRGSPFASLADFVNRSSGQVSGLLQGAIEAAGLNDTFDDTVFGGVRKSAFAPGYLTQSDLLSTLGPVLAVRSDTFLIRAYGESVNPVRRDADGNPLVEGRAWCEAVVQRVPDYVEPSSTQRPWDAPTAGSLNEQLGRRFEIVSFRWLTPNDL